LVRVWPPRVPPLYNNPHLQYAGHPLWIGRTPSATIAKHRTPSCDHVPAPPGSTSTGGAPTTLRTGASGTHKRPFGLTPHQGRIIGATHRHAKPRSKPGVDTAPRTPRTCMRTEEEWWGMGMEASSSGSLVSTTWAHSYIVVRAQGISSVLSLWISLARCVLYIVVREFVT
jgi:hypothetical protein